MTKKYAFISDGSKPNEKEQARLDKLGKYLSERGYILVTRGEQPSEEILVGNSPSPELWAEGTSHFLSFTDEDLDLGCDLYPSLEKKKSIEISNRVRNIALLKNVDFLILFGESEDTLVATKVCLERNTPCFHFTQNAVELAGLLKSLQV